MSSRTAGEAVKKFVNLVHSSGILKKHDEILAIISGPLAVSREKLKKIKSSEAIAVLTRISPNYHKELEEDIIENYNEEVEKGRCIVEEIETVITELQKIFETINQRLQAELQNEKDKPVNPLVLSCYEDCRGALIFIRIKSRILKHHLLSPPDEPLSANPFSHCPEFVSDEETFVLLLCKLQAANFNQE